MKKIKKMFKKLNNAGSSIVMVIVALAFVGIIVGALLTAVGYAYRLKLQDLNSRDNFYYVEQAMNEIYAGVGSQTVEDMRAAYEHTVENMVYYDLAEGGYVTRPDDEVQAIFLKEFMDRVSNNDIIMASHTGTLGDELEKFISNDSVTLDKDKLYVAYERDADNNLVKITIKNVVLNRTQQYDKSVANGAYTQTISTDIEIGEPDFSVIFNSSNEDYLNVFDYSMVADMGIEVYQPAIPLTITGDIYAASDYYNKLYNSKHFEAEDAEDKYNKVFDYDAAKYTETVDGVETIKYIDNMYTHGNVTSKTYTSDTINEYYNTHSSLLYPSADDGYTFDYYDGVNERSMYSGFYVNNSSVSVLADMVIVPGTVAVMNSGTLGIYGKDGQSVTSSEIWVDNLVLDGYSKKTTTEKTFEDGSTKEVISYNGSNVIIRANLYVKDDTEINSRGSAFKLNGSYYGYGDSTEKDTRKFIPIVEEENFVVPYEMVDAEGNKTEEFQNRGHYNSSAIIINGDQSQLDLSQTNRLFLAGRTYIELSKNVEVDDGIVGEESTTPSTPEEESDVIAAGDTVVRDTYTFTPANVTTVGGVLQVTDYIRDYQTGESLSVKTNQLAYIPALFSELPTKVEGEDYYDAKLKTVVYTYNGANVKTASVFDEIFPMSVFGKKAAGEDTKYAHVPCVLENISGRSHYYYDFKTAYEMIEEFYNDGATGREAYMPATWADFQALYGSPEEYATAFIIGYTAELNDENSVIKEYLTDIGNFEDLEFNPTQVLIPQETDAVPVIYSSGALTTKTNTTFSIVRDEEWDKDQLASMLLNHTDYNSIVNDMTGNPTYNEAYDLSDDLELQYVMLKWNLGHYDLTTDEIKNAEIKAEMDYIKALSEDEDYGEAAITPINKYLNMDNIIEGEGGTDIKPNLTGGDSGAGILDLTEYSVWVSSKDVEIKAKSDDDGLVRGIVVSKGDVTFNANVTDFEGLIIAGGKVYISNNLRTMTASPSICKAVLRECSYMSDDSAQFVLNLFKGYELDENNSMASSTDADNSGKTIDSIDYSDVCRFSNWMKNVE